MKTKLLLCLVLAASLLQWQLSGCRSNSRKGIGDTALKQYYTRQTDTLLHQLDLLIAAADDHQDQPRLQTQFVTCRLQYKKIEAIAEYYFQGLMQRINGPALPDVKIEDGQVWPPHGFQVIEQLLYDGYADSLRPRLAMEIRLLQNDLRFMLGNMAYNPVRPHHVRELIRHQFIRIAALGITGFDAPLSKRSLQEAIFSLNGIREIARVFGSSQNDERTNSLFAGSIRYLESHPDFDSFNRLEFLTDYLMPLSEAYDKLQGFAEQEDSTMVRPFSGTLSGLMKGVGFNADYYAGFAAAKSSEAKIALGRKLFSDSRLSGSAKMSCASCHKPGLFFTDGHAKAEDFVHGGSLPRNTPTLYYAALQSHQFYDLRAVSLEDQADMVMNNHSEFNCSSATIAKRLSADTAYSSLFKQAFDLKGDSLSGFEVRNALAAFVRSLSPFSSPFDEYMRGKKSALTSEQVDGFNLFAGKAKCATCHFIPLFNGNIPPWFNHSESEIIGVPEKPIWKGAAIDPDSGRFAIHRFPELLFAFKTPGLRNVEKTAPYMHNGVYKTLDEVVEFYRKGGGAGLGIKLPSQSLPFDSLALNNAEKIAIVRFLESLTDEAN
jgi:cytochrome c peroxidase